jgi:uncharacterized protein (DUF433 family)
MVDTARILEELRQRREKVNQAIALIESLHEAEVPKVHAEVHVRVHRGKASGYPTPQEVLAARQGGASVRDLMKKFKVSDATIYNRLKEAQSR